MAKRLSDGSIRLSDGRVIYANSIVLAQDICELMPLLCPQVEEAARAGAIFPGLFRGGGGGFGGGGPGTQGRPGIQGPPGPINQIQDEGVNLPIRNILNFIGEGVQAVDNPGTGSTDVFINDLFASARIVSNNPDEGTDLTIQDAINNLPAGGDIYVKPGTYVMPAALTSQPAPITIRGAGIGVTILDFGTVAGKFISIDHDAPINLSDLTILAGGLAGQYLYDVGINYLGTEIFTIDNVQVGDQTDTTKAIEGVILGGMFGQFTNFVAFLQTTVNSYFADSGAATPGACYVMCEDTSIVGSGAQRLKWGGFKNLAGGVFGWNCIFGVANFGAAGFVVAFGNCSFIGGGTTSTLSVTAFSSFSECYFNDVALAPGSQSMITGCISGSIYTLVDRIIDIVTGTADVSITGCAFASWSVETIRNDGTNVTVSGCVGIGIDVVVTETANADFNNYWDIDASSTIVGQNTKVNGAKLNFFSAVTTSAFVTMMGPIVNPRGLQGVGTVENKGAQSIDVKQLFTDAFGTTSTTTTTVIAGGELTLSLAINIGTGRPPYVSYEVQVKDTVNGSHGLPELFFTSQGAML